MCKHSLKCVCLQGKGNTILDVVNILAQYYAYAVDAAKPAKRDGKVEDLPLHAYVQCTGATAVICAPLAGSISVRTNVGSLTRK